jgi:hypothetical protein
MVYFKCDHCGKEMNPGDEQRFIIKIEAYPARDPNEITEADLDDDHMEAVSELLRDMDGADLELDEPRKSFRYDLCEECHRKFVQDPLGKENSHKLYFSKN